jgi:hypothetical protein
VAARALVAGRQAQVSWQLVEAEAGTPTGAAEVVTPASAWTGESAWSGGAYLRLGPGGRVVGTVDLPVGGGWWLFPVLDRQQLPAGVVATGHRLGGAEAGRVDHGGAGPQGVTAVPGYLDAVLVQPEVEWLVLGGSGGGQAVARSYDRAGRLVEVATSRDGHLRVPVAPGGFTVASR